jgi:formylglycine-generating enzyme required for sulfatase activity
MKRLLCFSLIVALASYVPIYAQPKDPTKNFTNSIGMKFVWIPPGNFMMGSPKEEKDRGSDQADETQHLPKGSTWACISSLKNNGMRS